MANRIDKVNSLLEHEIGGILARDFKFPEALVTLTRVETFANLIGAKCYISVMPEQKTAEIVKVLNRNVQDVQQQINKKLNMRPIPKITFVEDTRAAEAGKVEELLHKLKKEET